MNNKYKTLTQRDYDILSLITNVRVCTSKQIKDLLFDNVTDRVCYRRLTRLIDCKLIKRSYYRVDTKNIYVYYLDKKPKKRNIKHDLLVTQCYVELIKNGYEVLEFQKAPKIIDLVPDAIVTFKTPQNKISSLFLEIQLSNHDCVSKYFNIKNKFKENNLKFNMDSLYIVTNKKVLIQKLQDLNLIIDELNFKKIRTLERGK